MTDTDICAWIEDDEGSASFDADCGGGGDWSDGTGWLPAWRFCPYCGQPMRFERWEEGNHGHD